MDKKLKKKADPLKFKINWPLFRQLVVSDRSILAFPPLFKYNFSSLKIQQYLSLPIAILFIFSSFLPFESHLCCTAQL
jgi:hypothetical protein